MPPRVGYRVTSSLSSKCALNPEPMLKRWLPATLTLLVLLALWQFATPADSPYRVVPSPAAILAALARDFGLLLTAYLPITLAETGLGLLISVTLGVLIAALLDLFPLLRQMVYPLLIISQTIPLFALAPVLILLLGFGIEPKITIVVLFCTFPITISTLDGLAATRPEHVTLLESFGATRATIWRTVRLPSALPGLFSGLRIAATYSVTGAIVGEYIAPTAGIGRYMRTAYQSFKTEEAFGAAVVVIGLSVLIVGGVAMLERLILPWRRGQQIADHWNELD